MAVATVTTVWGALVHPRQVGIPMKTSVKFVSVCAGAPIAALCFGGATAWAEPSTSEESSETTATQQTTKSGLAIAFNGTATAKGNDNTSYAIPQSTAEVTGDNNLAVSLCGGSVTISGQSDQIRTSAPCLGG